MTKKEMEQLLEMLQAFRAHIADDTQALLDYVGRELEQAVKDNAARNIAIVDKVSEAVVAAKSRIHE